MSPLPVADELTAKVVGAIWWERGRGVEQTRRTGRSARRRRPSAVPADECEIDDGRRPGEFHRDDARSRISGGRGTDRQSRHQHDRPGRPGRRATTDGRAGVPAALPHDRRSSRAGGPRRGRGGTGANGPSDTRPHIAHIQVIHPDDIDRFRELGVTANAQPYWACHEDQMDHLTASLPRARSARPGSTRSAHCSTRARRSRWDPTGACPRPIRWPRWRWP